MESFVVRRVRFVPSFPLPSLMFFLHLCFRSSLSLLFMPHSLLSPPSFRLSRSFQRTLPLTRIPFTDYGLSLSLLRFLVLSFYDAVSLTYLVLANLPASIFFSILMSSTFLSSRSRSEVEL